jgi:hypothetical protein
MIIFFLAFCVNLKYCQLLLFAVGRMHSSEPVPKTKGFLYSKVYVFSWVVFISNVSLELIYKLYLCITLSGWLFIYTRKIWFV